MGLRPFQKWDALLLLLVALIIIGCTQLETRPKGEWEKGIAGAEIVGVSLVYPPIVHEGGMWFGHGALEYAPVKDAEKTAALKAFASELIRLDTNPLHYNAHEEGEARRRFTRRCALDYAFYLIGEQTVHYISLYSMTETENLSAIEVIKYTLKQPGEPKAVAEAITQMADWGALAWERLYYCIPKEQLSAAYEALNTGVFPRAIDFSPDDAYALYTWDKERDRYDGRGEQEWTPLTLPVTDDIDRGRLYGLLKQTVEEDAGLPTRHYPFEHLVHRGIFDLTEGEERIRVRLLLPDAFMPEEYGDEIYLNVSYKRGAESSFFDWARLYRIPKERAQAMVDLLSAYTGAVTEDTWIGQTAQPTQP